MKYAVFGPRELKYKIYDNMAHVASCLNTLTDINLIISGGGQGIESLAEQYASSKKLPFTKIPPNFQSATDISVADVFATRNMEMMMACDKVVVFWDGVFAAIVPILQRSMVMQKPVLLFPLM